MPAPQNSNSEKKKIKFNKPLSFHSLVPCIESINSYLQLVSYIIHNKHNGHMELLCIQSND